MKLRGHTSCANDPVLLLLLSLRTLIVDCHPILSPPLPFFFLPLLCISLRHCPARNSPSSFAVPFREEEQFHVAVKRSSLAHMRRTPQENVFKEIAVMVSRCAVVVLVHAGLFGYNLRDFSLLQREPDLVEFQGFTSTCARFTGQVQLSTVVTVVV